MSAGNYRDKLTVQCVIEAENDSNEMVETWATTCEPWGNVEPLRGSEHSMPQAQQNLAEVVYQVEMRADPDTTLISPKMRILWTDPSDVLVELYVAAVLKSPSRDVVRLLAQERA